ncbi:MAG: class I SAM-dependent methyltransferase [Chloroflexi bacterium]|nr:class I SAM-dependent methyltransferase [Chloroflexota bacterium]MCL5075622.1 class I SAM-dependent methyltransferase [Chloroflexota bacterium]
MENVNCNLCGSAEREPFCSGRDRLYRLEGDFELVRCPHCHLIYLNPRPCRDEIERYYPPDSYKEYLSDSDRQNWFLRLNRCYGMKKRCRAVLKMKREGRLLDVGCATGDFLAAMRRHGGWEVCGVELNAEAAAYARQHFGLPVFAGQLEEAGFPAAHFDVVTLWNVLEHLPDPTGSLKEIERVLKEDGLLLLTIPNLDSVDSRLFGPYWALLEIPRHLYLFPSDALERMLTEAGFKIVKRECFFGGWYSFITSLQFLFEEKTRRMGSGKNIWADRPLSQGLRFLLQPYFFLADRFLKGPLLTLSCRRMQA